MGLRIAIDIGQYPMGEPTPRSGVFVGRGATPLEALEAASWSAREYYAGTDARSNPHWQAAYALGEIDFKTFTDENQPIFTPEDHYNCRLFIHERHKGA